MARAHRKTYSYSAGKPGRPEIDSEAYEAVEHTYRRVYGHLNPKTRTQTGLLKIELGWLEEAQKALPRGDREELSRWAARLTAYMVKGSLPGVGGRRVANMASALKKMRKENPSAWGKNPFDEAVEMVKNGEADEPLS
jgi:hypothetical protein